MPTSLLMSLNIDDTVSVLLSGRKSSQVFWKKIFPIILIFYSNFLALFHTKIPTSQTTSSGFSQTHFITLHHNNFGQRTSTSICYRRETTTLNSTLIFQSFFFSFLFCLRCSTFLPCIAEPQDHFGRSRIRTQTSANGRVVHYGLVLNVASSAFWPGQYISPVHRFLSCVVCFNLPGPYAVCYTCCITLYYNKII